MKKTLCRILSLVLAITVLSACLCAGAELKLDSGSINIHSGIRINVDGKEFVPVDSEGVPVEVFLYNGTTYLPVRGISNLFGLGIDWDNETKSVYLGTRDGKELAPYSAVEAPVASPFAITSKTITVYTGVSIYYNDEYFHPTDSEGFSVEVFLYNGTTYLPVRAISTLMDAEIDWDQESKTVLLTMEEPAPVETEEELIVKAAKEVAKEYLDTENIVIPYYRYYLKICTVLEEGLEEVKALYLTDPFDPMLEYMLNTYVMGYDGFEKEFGTYINNCVDWYELAKTLTKRIDSYAEDGYSEEELEKIEANTAYLNENLRYFKEYISLSTPEAILAYFYNNAALFGETNVVEQIGEIEFE